MCRLDGKLISGMFRVCRDAHNENRNTNDSCSIQIKVSMHTIWFTRLLCKGCCI